MGMLFKSQGRQISKIDVTPPKKTRNYLKKDVKKL